MTHYVVVVCDELDPMEQNFYFDDFRSALDFYKEYLDSCYNYPMACQASIFKTFDLEKEV